METVKSQQVGGRTEGGDGAFVLPRDLRNVIAEWDDGTRCAVDPLD